MSLRHERIVENPPSIDQLRTLASISMNSAASRQALRGVSKDTHKALFTIDHIDRVAVAGEENLEPVEIQHRMSVRFGLREDEQESAKVWSLKYADTYSVRGPEAPWINGRTQYRFEWSQRKVLLAERAFRLIEEGNELDETTFIDQVARFKPTDDLAALWHAEQEMERVTPEDCDELIARTQEYFQELQGINAR